MVCSYGPNRYRQQGMFVWDLSDSDQEHTTGGKTKTKEESRCHDHNKHL